ncbi:hypothetical protein [Microcella alkaliphila]|uniref:hypothetical protein n=1 Tax=Microcella alkaliphila TaxID=279828 RepID=UPI00102A7EBD|nr:hypothetical protein [Microcella alkaliphila]
MRPSLAERDARVEQATNQKTLRRIAVCLLRDARSNRYVRVRSHVERRPSMFILTTGETRHTAGVVGVLTA